MKYAEASKRSIQAARYGDFLNSSLGMILLAAIFLPAVTGRFFPVVAMPVFYALIATFFLALATMFACYSRAPRNSLSKALGIPKYTRELDAVEGFTVLHRAGLPAGRVFVVAGDWSHGWAFEEQVHPDLVGL